jgi:hypothetical protein
LTPQDRSNIILKLADLLQTKQSEIFDVNMKDLIKAEASGNLIKFNFKTSNTFNTDHL